MQYITTDSKKLTSDEVHNLVDEVMPSDEEGTEEEDNCEPVGIIHCGRESNDSFPPENNNSDDLSVPKVSEKRTRIQNCQFQCKGENAFLEKKSVLKGYNGEVWISKHPERQKTPLQKYMQGRNARYTE